MESPDSPSQHCFLKNSSLILLSLVFLPFCTLFLFLTFLLSHFDCYHGRVPLPPDRTKTVLITGVGTTKGLSLAREFYRAGHNVIGADIEPDDIPVCARVSKAILRFYRLPCPSISEIQGESLDDLDSSPYSATLLEIVKRELVDVWIPCSNNDTELLDGHAKVLLERETSCVCILHSARSIQTLHSNDHFIPFTAAIGLPVPETHQVHSRQEVHKILNSRLASDATREFKYTLTPVDSSAAATAAESETKLLPGKTISETYDYVAGLAINRQHPFILQQHIEGERFCTHALVIKGEVKAFVVVPLSSDSLMYYDAIPQDSPLAQYVLSFTVIFAKKYRDDGKPLTGHLSFDFVASETPAKDGMQKRIYAVTCHPRVHTAVTLFSNSNVGQKMVVAYLEALETSLSSTSTSIKPKTKAVKAFKSNGIMHTDADKILTPGGAPPRYWIGDDLVCLVLYPLVQLMGRELTFYKFMGGFVSFAKHAMFWKDAVFEVWDPIPWWYLYHVYWPGRFTASLFLGRNWKRIDVSTGDIIS